MDESNIKKMPIDRVEWAKARTEENLESKINKFLRNNNKNAYNSSEIARSIYNYQANDFSSSMTGKIAIMYVEAALSNLIRVGKVKSKIIIQPEGTDTYYISDAVYH